VNAVHAFQTQNLPHAPQIDLLKPVAIQRNHVLDGPAQIRFLFRHEQDSTGADVLCDPGERDALRASADDGEGKLKSKAPGSSLFHLVNSMLSGSAI
jgi:hypothetical protein